MVRAINSLEVCDEEKSKIRKANQRSSDEGC